ncbi:TPA_exp: Uncharacterized protein A8136_1361 [Trichophyton benhamiae CBS 112371]|uniref:Mitochondrial inner membrane protein 1 n=2 Tax=Trichophyton TaxID=5550 RepID=D4AW09_ARTBC|nr:uncharacterized protein ARB_00373 [Trichophyton benhamiae CBS 112371]XP_003021231.1 uncharacterized protein TRV_04663 [Trichophyton verrucosum HKI 0517]EFE32549.1 hypothetical protein ARB_00373 [Trichophyton benhamiae CBS 112371]EFE40613.1 hypothetical protein TRV_04663 [Trichophyton verrucosum HKI 0517]DAA75639.1 TPA_exp: Uncharacterized protein A8136_1361 [Trichophyton benhamiae CBS 112371]
MLYRTAAARSVLRAVSSSNASIARSAWTNTAFKAQLTTSARQWAGPRSTSMALSPFRQPVTTALVRYSSTEAKKTLIEEPDVDMMAGVKNDVKIIKDTFSLEGVPKEALYYGLAGVVPYVVTSLQTVFLSWEMNNAVTLGTTQYISVETAQAMMNLIEPIQVGYGAVILSFLGAVHWGMEWAGYGGKHGFRRYATGVVAPAVAWPTLLLPVEYALITQFFAFTFLYYNDTRAAVKGWVPAWYGMYRFVLTFVVGAAIVCSLVGREQLASHFTSEHGITEKIKALQAAREKDLAKAEAAAAEEAE